MPAELSRDAIRRILTRASTDRAFRERLLQAPQRALADIIGSTAYELRVRCIEKDPTLDVLLVLPAFGHKELTEEDLELVSGGEGYEWSEEPEPPPIDPDKPVDPSRK